MLFFPQDVFTFQIWITSRNSKICLWDSLMIPVMDPILPAREGLFDQERAQNIYEPAALEAESEVVSWSSSARSWLD